MPLDHDSHVTLARRTLKAVPKERVGCSFLGCGVPGSVGWEVSAVLGAPGSCLYLELDRTLLQELAEVWCLHRDGFPEVQMGTLCGGSHKAVRSAVCFVARGRWSQCADGWRFTHGM